MVKHNRQCPICKDAGHDSKKDHLWLMEDGLTWCCDRVEYHPSGKNYYERASSTSSYNKEGVEDVLKYPIFNKQWRNINPDVWAKFEIRVGVDEETGEDRYLYFPVTYKGKLVGYHVRDIKEKKFRNIGNLSNKKLDLFGQNHINKSGGKSVIITEGHLDALSIYQTIKNKYKDIDLNIVSVNNGTGSYKDIADNKEDLEQFEKIILAFDNDTAGSELKNKVSKLFEKVYLMEFSEKDANDVLKVGKDKEIIAGFFNPRLFIPTGVVSTREVVDLIIKPVSYGLSYPWSSLTELTFGLTTPSIITIGSGPGVGKSTFLNSIIKHIIYEHREPVGYFPLEEPAFMAMKKIIGSIIGKRIHIPGTEYDIEEVKKVANDLADKIFCYDHVGFLDWDNIVSTIRYMSSIGIRYFFIDPLTSLVARYSSSEANDVLNKIYCETSSLVNCLNISLTLISHLNNPAKANKDHSTGARVLGSQFTGSRAGWRYSTDLWGLSRDLLETDEIKKNQTIVSVLKNRLSGDTGLFTLQYNKMGGNLDEITSEF